MKATIPSLFWLAGLGAAQSSGSASRSILTISGSQSLSGGENVPVPTVPANFQGSLFSTLTTSAQSGESTLSSNATASATSSGEPLTNIGGGNGTRSATQTASGTSPAQPSNTQPCNNYAEFCNRKYSNITEVAAHNSPYTRANNVARNQEYGVTQQLNDGIRMLQGSAHYVNGTLFYCHSSCDLLNAGTVEDYLVEVTAWVEAHPFDVVTILFGNSNWADTDADGKPLVTSVDFADPIEKSGLKQYIYQPPKPAMTLEDWPTLSEMILNNDRVVTFIDYNFDTENVPYLLWEFYNVWETPFSPTSAEFPCTLGRPEGLAENQMRNMMYMANHNLNAEINFAGLSLLVPNVAQINQTNALSGDGSLGLMTNTCTSNWDRPPNFLLVDFYNQGPVNGSVFEVAARANNVTYNRQCCGKVKSAGVMLFQPSPLYVAFVALVGVALAL
ncbi:PLC-like phosphodiesterase [Plenodomus tracheiphilus IPT5]|uniref:PLC-like phosphodiesterase n=1 Tax=Plenodomus tracheiphilus IPT5 TaxID=1408161 RepID=A0A6A7ASM8_9PLEO|nr:PLC-like phosphodiesterase [Plenodomus tracheiphilus IPT5]